LESASGSGLRAEPASPDRARRGHGFESRQERLAYAILLPVLGTVFVVVTYPLVFAVGQSLRATRGGGFVGLQNYASALENPLLYDALGATGVYAGIVLPTEILAGLGLALLVHRTVRSPRARLALYVFATIPIVIPPVAVGVIARLIYAPGYGVLNHLLMLAGVVQAEIPWLSRRDTAMLAVSSVDVWQWTPFVYLVFFAGLQTVPRESIDAAQVDGATGWTMFSRIELPYLRPLFLMVLFWRIADVLRVFDHIFILTGGGPGSTTQLLSVYLYRVAFKFFDTGEAAALAVMVMLAMSLLYTAATRLLPLERD
jgi:multiple sugar transport system permease protein